MNAGLLYLQAITDHYGERTAQRSGVPLINHIKEGLIVMKAIGASESAMCAFCIHPLFQADADLAFNRRRAESFDPFVMMLVMEYRNQANRWLSDKIGMKHAGFYWRAGPPSPGPLLEVRDMLIADKVQNRADFLIHHRATHPRGAELAFYFEGWLDALGIDESKYHDLVERMKS